MALPLTNADRVRKFLEISVHKRIPREQLDDLKDQGHKITTLHTEHAEANVDSGKTVLVGVVRL